MAGAVQPQLLASRLNTLFCADLGNWEIPVDQLALPEPELTGTVLIPQLLAFVSKLGHKSLVVTGDRFSPPTALTYAQMSFVPDIEILDYGSRLLGIEVKVIRDTDPSGAFTKSLGQAVIYRSLGFYCAHVLVLDCRKNVARSWNSGTTKPIGLPDGIGLSVFSKTSADRLTISYQSVH